MGEPVDHSDGAEGDNDSDDAEEEIGKEPHYLNFLAKKIGAFGAFVWSGVKR